MRFNLHPAAALLLLIPLLRSGWGARVNSKLSNRLVEAKCCNSDFRIPRGRRAFQLRGGASDAADIQHLEDQKTVTDMPENDSDEYDEYDSSDYESETPLSEEIEPNSEYLEPYLIPPSLQLYATFGCMILSKKVDMFSPFVVKLIRFAFIAQILLQQLFILYVRLVAKSTSDMRGIDVRNQVSDVLMSQLQLDGNSRLMIKRVASSFLCSKTTMMDYDLKQASNMQGGVILNMGFMWFLHFKLDKVQPLLIQAFMGFLQLIYNPLFQVYVLGRNLERPFNNQSRWAPPSMVSTEEQSKEQGLHPSEGTSS